MSMYASTPGVGFGWDGSIRMWSSLMNFTAAARALAWSFSFHTSRYSFRTTALFLLPLTPRRRRRRERAAASLTAASATPADASAVTTLSNILPRPTVDPGAREKTRGDGAPRRRSSRCDPGDGDDGAARPRRSAGATGRRDASR